MIDASNRQQAVGWMADDHINRGQTFYSMNHILGFGIGHEHIVLPPIPCVSKPCLMSHEATLLHECCNLRSRSRFAQEDGLACHDPSITTCSMNTEHSPIQAKNFRRKADTLKVLRLSGKTAGPKKRPHSPACVALMTLPSSLNQTSCSEPLACPKPAGRSTTFTESI